MPLPESAPLASDPSYLAFLRALGINDVEDTANVQVQIDALNRRANLATAEIADRGQIDREQLSGSFESRGLSQSGTREKAMARQQADEVRRTNEVGLNTADETARLVSELAAQRASRQRQLAEQGVRSADEITVRDA